MSHSHKKRRLEAAVQAVQLKWGQQALHKGTLPTATSSPPSLSTGLPTLDRVLRIGGLPLGHISELIGQPTSGKRTLALHILAQSQRRYPCLYLDLTQTLRSRVRRRLSRRPLAVSDRRACRSGRSARSGLRPGKRRPFRPGRLRFDSGTASRDAARRGRCSGPATDAPGPERQRLRTALSDDAFTRGFRVVQLVSARLRPGSGGRAAAGGEPAALAAAARHDARL